MKISLKENIVVNLNIRVLGNGFIFVQYQEAGKAQDAAFPSWKEFVTWLASKTYEAS